MSILALIGDVKNLQRERMMHGLKFDHLPVYR